jgi:Protein of unknown function (DUF2783)
MELITQPHLTDTDSFYEALINSQRDLTDEEAALMNAKLILTMANHIGNQQILLQALAVSRPLAKKTPDDLSAS